MVEGFYYHPILGLQYFGFRSPVGDSGKRRRYNKRRCYWTLIGK